MLPAYAELHALSHFSFQRAASSPDEMVARAAALGYSALAITDECSMAGVVRAHVAAREHGLKLLVGSQFRVQGEPAFTLVLLATSLDAYGHLCEFITRLRRRSPKGSYRLAPGDIDGAALAGCLAIAVPDSTATQDDTDAIARWLLATGEAPDRYVISQGTVLGRAGRVHVEQDAQGVLWTGGGTVTCIHGQVML